MVTAGAYARQTTENSPWAGPSAAPRLAYALLAGVPCRQALRLRPRRMLSRSVSTDPLSESTWAI